MNITVFGLGHIARVTAACLARNGHRVRMVGSDARRAGLVNAGQSADWAPDLNALITRVTASGMLQAGVDAARALEGAHAGLICADRVGGGGESAGSISIGWAAREIGRGLGVRDEALTVILRSPVLPGVTEDVLMPALREVIDADPARVRVAVNPDFMRERTALADFDCPPMILVGTRDPAAAALVRTLHHGILAPFVHTSVHLAEVTKAAGHAHRGVKYCFPRELADGPAASQGDDSQRVTR